MRVIEGGRSAADKTTAAATDRQPTALRRDLAAPCDRPSAGELFARYRAHLERSPLAQASRRAYERQAREYLIWIASRGDDERALADPLQQRL